MTPLPAKNRTIGLLGGSFNPAHEGHLHITLYALKKLSFDEVWWLVSPHNPLKAKNTLADYEERLESARDMAAGHPHIRVLDLEAQHNLQYSWQTVQWLKRHFPGTHFAWLMGADNLAQLHRWRRWQWLLSALPFVVFDRVPYSHTALRNKAFLNARRYLRKTMDIAPLPAAPCLVFVHLRRHGASSTAIRKRLGKAPFLRHNESVGK